MSEFSTDQALSLEIADQNDSGEQAKEPHNYHCNHFIGGVVDVFQVLIDFLVFLFWNPDH
ncbi:MAG: hypothetical protein AAFV72_22810 [Cyanobacteria bacterium J06635_1]